MELKGQSTYLDKTLASHGKPHYGPTKPPKDMPIDGPKFMIAAVPIRLLIFVMSMIMIAVLAFLSEHHTDEVDRIYDRFLAGITCVFTLFTFIQIAGFFVGSELIEYPMLVIDMFAVVFYLMVGYNEVTNTGPTTRYQFGRCAYTIGIAILHITDMLLALEYWRYRYDIDWDLGPIDATYDVNTQYCQIQPPQVGVCKCDAQVGVSGTGLATDLYDDDPFQTRRMKKSGTSSVKSYVECPVRNAFSMTASRGMQSTYSPIQRDAQTAIIRIKDMPAQTSGRRDQYQHHINLESHSPRQYNASTYEAHAGPVYSTSLPSPTRPNLSCLCKNETNYLPP